MHQHHAHVSSGTDPLLGKTAARTVHSLYKAERQTLNPPAKGNTPARTVYLLANPTIQNNSGTSLQKKPRMIQ